MCRAGTYSPSAGEPNSTCIACAAGKANPIPGSSNASACLDCLPGTYASEEGVNLCSSCAAGKYQGARGQTACINCAPGSLCIEGSSAPQPCPGGTHANQTIVQSGGFLTSLEQCITCPPGTYCGMGSSEPTPCLMGTYTSLAGQDKCRECPRQPGALQYQPERGQTACATCGAGSYSANILSCLSCAIGEYCEEGVERGSPCESVLAGSTTFERGATSPNDCVCQLGHFLNYASATIVNGTLVHAESRCELCPNSNGFDCREVGNAVEALAIPPGFWRANELSSVVRECPISRFCVNCARYPTHEFCAALTEESSDAAERRRRLSVDEVSQENWRLCRQHHTGAYCSLCTDGFFMSRGSLTGSGDGRGCVECPQSTFGLFVFPVFVFSLMLAFSIFFCRRGCGHGKRILNVQGKMRILISYVQVIAQLTVTFSIPYPPFYDALMDAIGVFLLDLIEPMPLECYRQSGIDLNQHVQLLIRTLVPLAILLVSIIYRQHLLFVAGWKRRAAGRSQDAPAPTRKGLLHTPGHKRGGLEVARAYEVLADELLTWNFVLFFLLYPSNSAKIFATLRCETFHDSPGEPKPSFLRTDLSIDCNDPWHHTMEAYAVVMIFVYPIGIPCVYAYLLLFKYGAQLRYMRGLELKQSSLIRAALNQGILESAARGAAPILRGQRKDSAEKAAVPQWSTEDADKEDPRLPRKVAAKVAELKAEEDALRAELPGMVQKLILGYELRTFDFELIECGRKLLIVCLPVVMQPFGSVAQLSFGLVVCFFTFGV